MGDMSSERGPAQQPAIAGAAPSDSVESYRAMFQWAYPRLVRTVWFVVHDHDLAQEIAQEAFVELYRRWPKVESYDRSRPTRH
jgi:DNA-directed RNA polymerase specialized sigma24 family protein